MRALALLLLAIAAVVPGLARAAAIDVTDKSVADWNGVPLFSDSGGDPGADVSGVGITADHPDDLFLRVDLASTPLLALYTFTLTYADSSSQTVSSIQGGTPRVSGCQRNCTLSYGSGKTAAGDTYFEIDIPYAKLSSSFKNGAYVVDMKFQSWAFSGGKLVSDSGPDTGAIEYDAANDVATAAQVIELVAEPGPGGVAVRWRTGAEVDNAGFRVLRAWGGGWQPVHPGLVPGAGTAGSGARYEILDASGRAGDRYLLEDVDERGRVTPHGPAVALDLPHLPARPVLAAPSPVRLTSLTAFGLPVPLQARPSQAAVLGADREGLYRIDPAELLAAGINPRTALSTRIRLRGPAGEVGVFSAAGAGLFFYAPPPVNGYDGVDRYLAEDGGSPPPLPARLEPARQAQLPPFESHLVLQQRGDYDWYTPGDDPYAWLMIRSSARGVLSLDLPDPAGAGTARMTVHLQGGRVQDRTYDLLLNGTLLGTASFRGLSAHVQTLEFPAGLLDASGKDLLEIRAEAGTVSDYIYVHAVEVEYQRGFVARDDELAFEVPGGSAVRVRGFSRPEVVLADVTSSGAPRALAVAASADPDGTFAISFTAPGRGPVRLLAAAGEALRLPTARQAQLRLLEPPGADLLVVAPRELVPALEPLLEARRAEGLVVEVATLEEVYDAFGGSQAGPASIRALVDSALTWPRVPRWLLLAGKGSANPRGLLPDGDAELVPTHFVITRDYHLRAPSDAWFGLRGDAMRIAVGRIPARNAGELSVVVGKILQSEAQPPVGRVLGVADGSHDGVTDGPTTLFEGEIDRLTAPFASVTRLAARTNPAVLRDLEAALGQGADLLVYSGHGWTGGWGYDQSILDVDAARTLTNERRPFVVTSTCWEANFSDVTGSSVALALLLDAHGGSMGAFGGSTILDLSQHAPLVTAVLANLASRSRTLGEAVEQGQNDFLASRPPVLDGLYTFSLLGDPSAHIPLAH